VVTPGKSCEKSASRDEVAWYTARTLKRSVPTNIAGITFLSGGQSEEQSSKNLNAIASIKNKPDWYLSFSYGQSLQETVQKTWLGKKENIKAA